jgi:hypothetical protein
LDATSRHIFCPFQIFPTLFFAIFENICIFAPSVTCWQMPIPVLLPKGVAMKSRVGASFEGIKMKRCASILFVKPEKFQMNTR